jgi:hypothetical protein
LSYCKVKNILFQYGVFKDSVSKYRKQTSTKVITNKVFAIKFISFQDDAPFASQASVTQLAPMWMNSSDDGRQIGRAKSENVIGDSSFKTTIELPSTGDSTIPTIRRFCSQGARLFNRTVAKRATHFDRPCLKIFK